MTSIDLTYGIGNVTAHGIQTAGLTTGNSKDMVMNGAQEP